jgi:membrane fusion protein, heavy metal efflux system
MHLKTFYSAFKYPRLSVLLIAVFAALLQQHAEAGSPDTTAKKAGNAIISSPVKESALNNIVLSAEAEARLGISTAKVVKREVATSRQYAGEVVIPSDQSLAIQAPFTGIVSGTMPGLGKLVRPGEQVKKGQAILEMTPMLSPETKTNLEVTLTDMRGQLSNAETQVNLTKIAYTRAQKLFEDKAGSQRNVQEAQAVHAQANDTFNALKQRQQLIVRSLENKGTKTTITAPETGVMTALNFQPGQVVSAGAILFVVSNQSKAWIRTAVPVGDIDQMAIHDIAVIQNFSGHKSAGVIAQPVTAPPTAVSNTLTVDVYHALNNTPASFTPGQRVIVELKTRGQAVFDTIPWRSVIFDIYGNTWVYEKTAALTYSRRRVVVDHVVGQEAALQHGPAPGKHIVHQGAPELFALETGYAK